MADTNKPEIIERVPRIDRLLQEIHKGLCFIDFALD